jgi:tetratricopeptide (TPR) repeat protein
VSQLTGAPHTVAVPVATVSDGYLSGATRLVEGYFDGPSSFHVAIEDLATHKMVATEDLHAGLLAAMDRTSRLITPEARPFSTSQEDNAALWGQGHFEEAVRKDPGFSSAWLGWVQDLLSKKDNEQALAVAERALAAKPELRSPFDRAQIELLAATLRSDLPSRMKALDSLAHLAPLDVQLWRALAEGQMNARNFPATAEALKQIIQLDPQNIEAQNLLGYAMGFAGDLEGARQAFTAYGKMPNQAANSIDSLGEVYFANGKFGEAEQAFRSANKANPGAGLDLWKAAYAQWLGGNLQGADQTMKEFLIGRVKQHDALTTWREAVWLYSTGREAQAESSLAIALRDDPGTKETQSLMEKQIEVWKNSSNLPHDPAALKTAYEHTPPTQDGLVRTLYARTLLEAGKKDEARKLVALWPLPESGGDPAYQAFLFPKFMEVRKAVQN